jgi:iron complex transport system ATP-binding protein
MLAVSGLELGAGGRILCSGLDLRVSAGEVWGVLGCNGSGKSTLLHAFAGLARPRAGRIEMAGRAIAGASRRELALQIGVLLQQEDQGYWGTVRDYVALGRYPHVRGPLGRGDAGGDPAVNRALAAFDLVARAAQPCATLSGGERQRARLAQLWAQDAQLLLLDEPLQYLDLRHQAGTMELITAAARAGKAAVVVLHDLVHAAHCNRILMLRGDGSHEQGAAAELLEPARLEALYGCRMKVCGVGTTAHVTPVI